MTNFEAGNLIRMKEDCNSCEKGKEYKLSLDGTILAVELPDGSRWCTCQHKWELIKKHNSTNTKPMKKLNSMMKRLLDKDTQALIKANYINGDLELTEEGRKALNTLLFLANKAELVKMAQEVIAEEEK